MIAIVVAYQNGPELRECCERLAEVDTVERIIIVDNSYSVAGSCVEAAGLVLGEKMVHLVPPGNLGFSGGNNYGIALARELNADHVLICNPDVEVNVDTISGLLFEMSSRSLDLVSPYMRETDSYGRPIYLKSPGWDLWLGRGVLDVSSRAIGRRYLPTFYGACFIVRIDLLDQIGNLSEDFFLYGEELDYCRRIDSSGLRWGVSNEHGVFHARGSSISPTGGPRKSLISLYHSSRSAIVVGRKYWPLTVLWWTVVRVGWAMLFLLKGNRPGCMAVLGGVTRGWGTALDSGSVDAVRRARKSLRQMFLRD